MTTAYHNQTHERLSALIHDYDNNQLPKATATALKKAHSAYIKELCTVALPEKPKEPFRLRLSQIGKPAIIQAFKLIGYTEPELGYGKLVNGVFYAGREFEARFKHLLLGVYGPAYDLKVTLEEADTEFCGVTGHADIILNDDLLLELKTMGSGSYRQASRVGIDDTLGYQTQLSAYQHSLDLPGVWVVEDKASTTIKLINGPDTEVSRERLDRAEYLITNLQDIERINADLGPRMALSQALDVFEIPEPRSWRGTHYLPWSMTWSTYREALYVYEQAEGKQPVFLDYMTPEETIEILEELVEEGALLFNG